jgi:long-chain acyl-CoA synthetase
VENGMLTPTFKIKRNKIEEAYGAEFDRWLKMKQPVVFQAA